MSDIKYCRACREPRRELSPRGRCDICHGEEAALLNFERYYKNAEALRKEADAAFDAIKNHFGSSDEN